jgi:soluble lytic murein transglycosylase
VAQVRSLLERVTDSTARVQAWELVPRAILASKDSAGAEAAYREAVATAVGAVRQARAWAIIGDLARARGDDAAATVAYRQALAKGTDTPGAARAAKGLLELPGLTASDAGRVATALDQAKDSGPALEAYDRYVQLSGGADKVAASARLARARLLAAVKGREAEAATEYNALSTDARLGAPALRAWANLRQKQGRTADVETLEGRLIQRFPTSAEAADVVFFRGDDAHDRNDLTAATREYRRVQAMAPDQDRAGLATMRVAQIDLLNDRTEQAAKIYEGYLASYPSGRRWQEASFWAARARLALGDSARARALVDRLRKDDPFSYYTVIASDLFGEPFTVDLPAGDTTTAPAPDWMTQGLEHVDLLRAAGLSSGAGSEVDRLVTRAKAEPSTILPLAEELIARDRTIEAINLGFEARRRGAPWTRRLARVVYPFRYQDVFRREAAEDGVDPYLTAALARQESAFVPDVHSSANAIGLMQLIASTAAQVARTAGPEGFKEEMLEIPDVNVHLGTVHLKELLEKYDGDITRFLAAYNAGAQRVVVWEKFAEAGSPLTFTERIPFAETRDYVKQVQRNVALYRQLYPNER